VQNGSCVGPILAAPMSEGGHLPDKIIVIINIKRIIVKGTKIIFMYFVIEWLPPTLELEPRSANHISTVLTARPRLQYKNHAKMAYDNPVINFSHFEEILNIIDITSIICIIVYGPKRHKKIWLIGRPGGQLNTIISHK
jgi:hypothetical protein